MRPPRKKSLIATLIAVLFLMVLLATFGTQGFQNIFLFQIFAFVFAVSLKLLWYCYIQPFKDRIASEGAETHIPAGGTMLHVCM